jgi:glycosyltransferase involved in cell wall biosynthesis
VICIADNVIPHEKRPGDFWFTKYFIKPVDAFITMSHQVLEDLKTFTTKKAARMIPHPLYDNFGERLPKETARKHLSIPENAFVFLFFGFIRKYKGLDLLLEAILLLKEQNRLDPNTRFLIAGEFYDDPKHYESLLRNPKIAPQLLLFTDFIPDSEVRYFLCAADAVVQPYRSATQSGVTPLAYHFEIPMVVTNVGGLPSLVPHGKSGLVCEPTANAIADALVELQKKGPESFKASLTQEKQKYSWQRMTEAIVELAQ